MQKKILALAVAAAFSAPAFADNANVTVYGKAFMSLDNTRTDYYGKNTATQGRVGNSMTTVHTNASRLGFKGEEDLGSGMKATFQYEAEFNLDANSNAATNGSGNAFMGTRNSKVGLAVNNVGEVFLGNWDTPYKLSHNPIELNDNTTFGSAVNVVGRFSSGSTNMNTRLKDSFNFHSANFSGFQVKLARGFDDAITPNVPAPATPVGTGINQAVTALSATFDNDMFYAGIATQTHNDTNGWTNAAGRGSFAKGTRLVGEYKFSTNGFVGLMVENLRSTVVNATGTPAYYAQRNIELSGKYLFTPSQSIALSFVKAGVATQTAANGTKTWSDRATQVSLRYGYSASKRTEIYALFTRLRNGGGTGAAGTIAAANYNFSGGTATTLTSQPGAVLNGMGVGMIVNF